MRVILIKGQSAYGALRDFIDALAQAFERRGITALVIDGTSDPDPFGTMARASQEEPTELVFSFNICGETRDGAGRTIRQIAGAPHIVQYVDHPFDHADRLNATEPASGVLCIDETHVDAVRSTYGATRFAYVGFSPHAAIGEPAPAAATAAEFAAARPIGILFPSTFQKPGDPPWAKLTGPWPKIFQAAYEIASSAEFVPSLDAVDQAMRDAGQYPALPELTRVRRAGALWINDQVRASRRFGLLKAAAKAGIPLHVYGKGYERQLYRLKNVTYGGDADLSEILTLMRQSRVVLSSNANFGAGSHERPLNAMMAGAAAACDETRFFAGNFRDGEEICLYRWKTLDDGLARIEALATTPDAAFEMARAGQARVMEAHCWDHRIDTILAAAKAVRETPATQLARAS